MRLIRRAGQDAAAVLSVPHRQSHPWQGMKTYTGTRTDHGVAVVAEGNGECRALDPRHDLLSPHLRQWVVAQAEVMGLSGPDNYILLLIRLEKQRQELEAAERLARQIVLRPSAQGDPPVPSPGRPGRVSVPKGTGN